MKIVAFQVEIGGIRSIVNDLGSIQAAIRATNEELKGARVGTAEYERLQRQLGSLRQVQSQIRADTRQQQRDFVQAADQGRRSYRALNAELVNLRNQFKDLSAEERNASVGQNLVRQIQALDRELKQIDAEIGNYQRNVGNYRQALLGVGDLVTGGLITGGLVAIGQEVGRAFRDSLQTFREFEQQIADLRAISGASESQILRLSEAAKELGRETQFTATQVAALQTEFARFGFSTNEILAATEATKNLSIATGEDLAQSAKVVAQTIRAYGLTAEDATRVTDVLSASFNSSGLQLNTFAEASKLLAPTARQLGISIEETTAAIGILADNGLEGTIATRTLGSAFLRLTDDTGKYRQAAEQLGVDIFDQQTGEFLGLANVIQQVREATKDLTEEQQLQAVGSLFGVDAAKNFNTLIQAQKEVVTENGVEFKESGELIAEYANSLRGAEGAAADAAGIVGDTLNADLLRARSAIEGFQIALFELNQGGIRQIVQGFSRVVNSITENLEPGLIRLSQIFAPLGPAVSRLAEALGFVGESGAETGRQITDFLVQALTFVADALTAVINTVATTVNVFRSLISAVAPANVLLAAFVNSIVNLPRTLSGIVAAFASIREAITNDFRILILDTQIAFNTVRGIISKSARDTVADLRAERDGIRTSGEVFADAFTEGFNRSVNDDISNTISGLFTDEVAEEAGNSAKKIEEKIEEGTDGVAEALGNGIEEGAERAQTAFESLTAQQNELRDSLRNAITEGRDYTETLEQYANVTRQVNDVNAEFKTLIEGITTAANDSDESVKALSTEVNNLQQELQTAQPGQLIALTDELIRAEQQLEEAQNEILRARNIAEGGTGLIEADIQEELDLIESIRILRQSQAQEQIENEQELQDALTRIKEQAEIESLEARLRLYEQGTDEFISIETELAQRRAALSTLDNETNLQQRLNDIESEKLARIGAIDELGLGEEALAARRKQIELEASRDILQTKLNQESLTNLERERLARELADKEIEINRAKNDEIRRQDTERLQQAGSLLEFVNNNVLGLAEAIGEVQDQAAERQIAQIEERYEREIDLAGENSELVSQLEEQREQEVELIQRRAFERQKRLQIAQAVINGAQAIIGTLAANPGPADILSLGAFRAIQIGLVVATTAAQIAAISRQTFAKGGYTGVSAQQRDSTGHRPVGVVHENEYVVPSWLLETDEGGKLVNQLEFMRKRGRKAPVSSHMAQPGVSSRQIIPYVAPKRGQNVNVNSKLSMSEEQVSIIATEVAEKTASAVVRGMIEGSEKAEIQRLRRQRLKDKTNG